MGDEREHARVLLSHVLDMDVADIGEEASFESLEAWDSIAHMRLIMAVEEVIGHEINPEILIEISNIEDIADVLGSEVISNE